MLGNLKNLIEHRELLFYLSMKDLKVRYKNAVLGFLWVLLVPMSMMVIFTIVFSFIVRIQVVNYPVFLLVGLFPWTFLSVSLSTATSSFVDNSNLIKKVRFPREVIPVSVVLANLMNFLLSLVVLLLFILFFNIKLTTALLLLPLIILIQVIFITGLSLVSSSLNVQYRDVGYIVGVVQMLWFYATPVFYPVSMVPEKFLGYYMLNPMAGIVTSYRDILINGVIPGLNLILLLSLMSLLSLIIGFIIFRKYEPYFADYV